MPIRAAVTLAVTAIGVVLLFSFRTPPAAAIATLSPSSTSSSTSTSSPTATPSGAPPSGGASPTPTATATPKPASGLKSGSFTGQSYANPYGNVQVQVVISGGKITSVKTIQYPNGHQQSVFINSQALPLLEQEVLQAQSAQINIIGGATFTSQGYAQSVQSALDAARA